MYKSYTWHLNKHGFTVLGWPFIHWTRTRQLLLPTVLYFDYPTVPSSTRPDTVVANATTKKVNEQDTKTFPKCYICLDMTEQYRLPGRPTSVSLRLPPNMQVVLPGSRKRTGFWVNVLCDTIIMLQYCSWWATGRGQFKGSDCGPTCDNLSVGLSIRQDKTRATVIECITYQCVQLAII